MNPIGGYFEWEFPSAKNNGLYGGEIRLNSCRHSLEYILRGLKSVSHVWIPYFTCDVMLEPLKKLGIPYGFYHINNRLEIANDIKLNENEILVYTNYYGIKDDYVKLLAEKYTSRLIVDNAQALFCKPNKSCHQIYSPRKYIGMPDGGLAVTTIPDRSSELSFDMSYERCLHLLKRHELHPSEGYKDFQNDDGQISNCKLSRMSVISSNIFASVDFNVVKEKRRKNFSSLHKILGKTNKLNIPSMDSFECPLIYPYWTDNGAALKKKLIANNIFIATYWPNVLERMESDDIEYELANNIICIPIDQRYGDDEMLFILNKIATI